MYVKEDNVLDRQLELLRKQRWKIIEFSCSALVQARTENEYFKELLEPIEYPYGMPDDPVNAQSFLDDVAIKKRTLVFSKQLEDESEISATAEKLKNDWVRLECLGQKGDASHLLIAYYIYAKEFFLDSKAFREKMGVEVIDRNKQTLNSTLLKTKKPLLLIVDKSVSQLNFGQHMLLREGDLVVVPSESRMSPIQLVIKRALTINGDFEALGSLKLLEDMECYGKVMIHGDIVFSEGTKLTATEGIYLSGKVRLGDEVLAKEDYPTYIDGEIKAYDYTYKKSKLYFLGLAPNR